jgi:hypothetical protein
VIPGIRELVSDGSYALTAVATDTANQAITSATVNVTVNNTLPTTMHCGDLDGTATSSGANWRATVIVTIHDASHTPVSDAAVSGTWSGGTSGTVSGTTSANGTVSFTTGSLAKRIGSVTFTITDVTGANLNLRPIGQSRSGRRQQRDKYYGEQAVEWLLAEPGKLTSDS